MIKIHFDCFDVLKRISNPDQTALTEAARKYKENKMTKHDLLPCQQAFEKWLKGKSVDISPAEQPYGTHIYKHPHVNTMWSAWKEAWKPDLLPCPICQSKVMMEYHKAGVTTGSLGEFPGHPFPERYSIVCRSKGHVVSVSKKTEQDAVETWNTRTPNKSAEVDLDALKKTPISPTHPELFPKAQLFDEGWNKAIEAVKIHLATGKGGDAEAKRYREIIDPPPQDGCGKINRASFEMLMEENLKWLMSMPQSLERGHIAMLIKDAAMMYYQSKTPFPEQQKTAEACENLFCKSCAFDDVEAISIAHAPQNDGSTVEWPVCFEHEMAAVVAGWKPERIKTEKSDVELLELQAALDRMVEWVSDAFNGNPTIMEFLDKDEALLRAHLSKLSGGE